MRASRGRVRPLVAMVVMNDITNDGRVKKTAASVSRLGYEVHVIGVTLGRPFVTAMGDVRLHRVRPLRLRPPLLSCRDGGLVTHPLAVFAFRNDRELVAAADRRRSAIHGEASGFTRLRRRIGSAWFRLRRKGLLGGRVELRKPRKPRETTLEEHIIRNDLAHLVTATESVVRCLIDLEPDLIHAHDITALHLPNWFHRASGSPAPWIYDAHEWVAGIGGNSRRVDAYTRIENELARVADAVITVSPPLADLLFEHRQLAERPVVVLNTPPRANKSALCKGLSLRTAFDLSEDVRIVVYPGVIKPARGLQEVIDALALEADLHLVLISDPDGAHLGTLLNRAESSGCADRIHVHPYVAPGDVATLMADATVGVHPLTHYSNAEVALPTKLFEFIQAGIPCVVSDVAAMSRFVRSTGVGEVYRSGDVGHLRASLRAVVDRVEVYRARIDANLRERYTWEAQEPRIESVYRRLLPIDQPEEALQSHGWQDLDLDEVPSESAD